MTKNRISEPWLCRIKFLTGVHAKAESLELKQGLS